MKKRFQTYNDGQVAIYREKERTTDFSAKKNSKSLDDLDYVCTLDFSLASKRQQDFEFAEQSSFTLSQKIKTRRAPDITTQLKAVIDDTLYDISYLDINATELYLFLQEVRKLAK